MIKLRDLEYLVAIDEHKHFGKAAEACFVSQPTLSGQIMKLEDQLSLQLVERHRRSVMLTPAGETLIGKARKVLQAAEEFESTAKSLLDPLAGDLHVGMIPTLAPYLLPHIMPGLNRALPNIHFYLHENKTQNLLQELNGGKLDLLILPYLEEMDSFDRYDLFDEELMLAVPANHPFSERNTVTLEDLKGEQILTLEDGHCLRDQALGYCFTAGAHEDNRFQATSLETLRYMVASGLGITLLPKLSTLNQQPGNNLHYLPFADPPPTRKISLVIRPNYSRMEAVRAVVSDLRSSLSSLRETVS